MPRIELKIKGETIYLDNFLKMRLDHVLKQQKKEFDAVILIDGNEGSGKSTLSFIVAWYLSNGNIAMTNICEGTDDAVDKLEHLPDRSVLIIDEGSLLFSSRDVMKRENKQLLKILNVIRQKCMILIVVAPSFFELEKYLAYRRSNFLLHVYLDKRGNRGRFVYFGTKKKKLLYVNGKKNYDSYAKPRGNFVGQFWNFKLPFDEEYQALKRRSLIDAIKTKKVELNDEFRRAVIKERLEKYLANGNNLTQAQLAEAYALGITTIKRYIGDVKAKASPSDHIINNPK